MRTTSRTITRREHWRWQRCGPGRVDRRRVLVRESIVRLGPTDAGQLNLLERSPGRVGRRRPPGRAITATPHVAEQRPVLRSYWRRQPYGPGSRLRKTILVDVHV